MPILDLQQLKEKQSSLSLGEALYLKTRPFCNVCVCLCVCVCVCVIIHLLFWVNSIIAASNYSLILCF